MNPPAPSPAIAVYASDTTAFKRLALEEQLMLIADITLYFAELKLWALEVNGKTRVDSCLEAQKYYAKEKYWEQLNQNLKKKAELETAGLRRGL